jgi:hypothetical protein
MTDKQPWPTREAWLHAAADQLRTRVFKPHDFEVPAFQVSVGWPAGKGTRSSTIGQCFNRAWNEDGDPSIFISPVLKDPLELLACLAHEMIHAWDDCKSGHKGPFARTFKTIGMVGKATEIGVGDELKVVLAEIADVLGKYPHGKLSRGNAVGTPVAPKRDTNRQLLVLCEPGVTEGLDKKSIYKVRTTQKWLDEVGYPICPCHNVEMIGEDR